MALNQIEFLRSPSVSVINDTKEITVTGSVDCSGVYSGTAIFINDNQVVEAVSGTGFNPVTGESTITLRYKWDRPTVTAGTLIGFNSIEGLNSVVTRLNEILNAIPDFTQFTGAGLIYSDGNGGYSIKQITTFGESVINAADAAALNAILGNPDFSPISGFAGVLKKDALDNYSLISSTAFGESLLTQADASSARSTLGVISATESAVGLIRKSTTAEAQGESDDNSAMTPVKTSQLISYYGLGTNDLADNLHGDDANNINRVGMYLLNNSKNTPNPDSSTFLFNLFSNGDWSTLAFGLQIAATQNDDTISFRVTDASHSQPWNRFYTSANLIFLTNSSGSTVASGDFVAGSSLAPPVPGTWRNISSVDVANGGSALFLKV